MRDTLVIHSLTEELTDIYNDIHQRESLTEEEIETFKRKVDHVIEEIEEEINHSNAELSSRSESISFDESFAYESPSVYSTDSEL